jgi:hypothetical protein
MVGFILVAGVVTWVNRRTMLDRDAGATRVLAVDRAQEG